MSINNVNILGELQRLARAYFDLRKKTKMLYLAGNRSHKRIKTIEDTINKNVRRVRAIEVLINKNIETDEKIEKELEERIKAIEVKLDGADTLSTLPTESKKRKKPSSLKL